MVGYVPSPHHDLTHLSTYIHIEEEAERKINSYLLLNTNGTRRGLEGNP
jgi:hypothetical protein